MELKTDLHVHDPEESWDSNSTRTAMVDKLVDEGFDVAGFVGHDRMADVHSDRITVLNGIEHTESLAPEVHVVEYPDLDIKFLAHPARISRLRTRETALRYMDEMEIYMVEKFNGGIQHYMDDIDVPQFGNSDAHNTYQIGSSYSIVDAGSNTQEGVSEAIINGDVEPKKGRTRNFGSVVKYAHSIRNGGQALQYYMENRHKR